MSSQVLLEFSRFRRRHLWVRGLDLFLESAFIMTVMAAGMLLVDRLAFELGIAASHLSQRQVVTATLLVPFALSAVFAAATLALRPTPPARLAWELDRAAGGEERILSALECAVAGNQGPFVSALFRDALRVAQTTEPARVLPRVPVGYRWGIVLSLAIGGLLWAYPPALYDPPVADLDASPRRGPAPLEVFFQDGSIGAIDEFLWDFGDGCRGSGDKISHAYEQAGIYTAKLTLRGPGGSSEKTCSIEVLPPDRAVADFRGKPLKGRGTLDVAFESLSRNAKRLSWDFGDGETSAEKDPIHTYTAPGVYDVRLHVENDLGSDEKARERYIKVSHPDEPLVDFRAMPLKGEAPLWVKFEDLSMGQLQEWYWDFGDLPAGAERLSRERNPTHVYKTPGHYTVRLRVKGAHGEDEEEKVRYIHVKNPGEGTGRGPQPQGNQNRQDRATKTGAGAGNKSGQLMGPPSARQKVNFVPVAVEARKTGDDPRVKELTVYTNPDRPNSEGPAEEVPFERAMPAFRRAAEDAIERELIPPSFRDQVRRYYELPGK